MTASKAYELLGISNDDVTDEQIATSCYSCGWGNKLEALETLLHARQSRWLLFFLSVYRHLNDSNVGILANRFPVTSPEPSNASEAGSSQEPATSQETGASQETERENGEGSLTIMASTSKSEMELDACGDPHGTPEDSSLEIVSPSSSEAEIPSLSDETSVESDFSEEVGGMIMDVDAAIWRCEECYLALIDGKCPHCHGVLRCRTCEWQLEYGISKVSEVL